MCVGFERGISLEFSLAHLFRSAYTSTVSQVAGNTHRLTFEPSSDTPQLPSVSFPYPASIRPIRPVSRSVSETHKNKKRQENPNNSAMVS
jgi:hypothetical protein